MKPEINQIQEVLKLELKNKSLRYLDLAKRLNISESTCKRLLNNHDISLSKLVDICHCLELDFFELIERSNNSKIKTHLFTEEQEKVLAQDILNFKYFRLLVMKLSPLKITNELSLSSLQSTKILKKLEEVNLIELWEYDKIKLKVNFPFKWRESGPLEKTYVKHFLEVMTTKIHQIGINNTRDTKKGSCSVIEFYLDKESQLNFEKDIKQTVDTYKSISKLNLKSSRKECSIYSAHLLSGSFSWWAE